MDGFWACMVCCLLLGGRADEFGRKRKLGKEVYNSLELLLFLQLDTIFCVPRGRCQQHMKSWPLKTNLFQMYQNSWDCTWLIFPYNIHMLR